MDSAAARHTPFHAAASGVVLRVECNAHLVDGSPYSGDVDGDRDTVRGCGWYTELLNADSTVTRYCHMVRRGSSTSDNNCWPASAPSETGQWRA